MIIDGYTQHGSFDFRRISYRPALYRERNEFSQLPRTEQVIREFIERHLVAADSEWRTWPEPQIKALFMICFGVIGPETGGDWKKDGEWEDVRNLYRGVVLQIGAPQVANRSCSQCKKWWFNEDTGRIVERTRWDAEKQQRVGIPQLRPENSVTLCQTNEGCPKGTPENPIELSPKNQLAWKHFRECDATGRFPDDPIVQRNAWVIRKAIKAAEKRRGR